MISVGVDVSRLGLMLVNGQPKASLNTFKLPAAWKVIPRHCSYLIMIRVRDKSGFEAFQAIHQSLYKDVEIMSTLFAPMHR